MDDTYAINVAKTEFREGFNSGNPDRVLSVFAAEFTDNSARRPSRYGKDAPVKAASPPGGSVFRVRSPAEHHHVGYRNLGKSCVRLRLARTHADAPEGRRGTSYPQAVSRAMAEAGQR